MPYASKPNRCDQVRPVCCSFTRFDNLKIDGCSAQHGVAMWSELINKTGTFTEIENCGNGPNPTIPVAEGGCPYYHQYVLLGDVHV